MRVHKQVLYISLHIFIHILSFNLLISSPNTQSKYSYFEDELVQETFFFGSILTSEHIKVVLSPIIRGITPIISNHGVNKSYSFFEELPVQERMARSFIDSLRKNLRIGVAYETDKGKIFSIYIEQKTIIHLAKKFNSSFGRIVSGVLWEELQIKKFEPVNFEKSKFEKNFRRFIISKAGHIVDSESGLIWANGLVRKKTKWIYEDEYWRAIPGLRSWRLPKKRELKEIVVVRENFPDRILQKQSDNDVYIWTADNIDRHNAWALNLKNHKFEALNKNRRFLIWPVMRIF